MAPEALRQFGSPWIVAGMPASCRVGADNWPCPGMGQFLLQLVGNSWLITFPYSSSLERGATMKGTEEWILNLAPATFNQFAEKSFKAVRLCQGMVAWVPYGWVSIFGQLLWTAGRH